MRAVTIERPGDFDVLQLGRREVRRAGMGEVRIAVKAAAVNPTDLLLRQYGTRGAAPAPWTPGMDAAGIVESLGPDVTRLRVGDAVMAVTTPYRPEGGAQAELLVVPETGVVAIPTGATFAEAATLPMNGLTALLALELLGLSAGETLAVSGGAGWLAYFTIAIAKQRGLRVIADAKPADIDLVRSYGADIVVPRGERFCLEVRTYAPDGVDGLLDTALLRHSAFPALKNGGVMVPVRGWEDESDTERGIQVRPVMVADALERTDWLERLRDLATRGILRPRVAGEYPVERVADAQRALAAGGLRGRLVLTF